MATNAYSEDQILTLEFDDGVRFDCGIMGIFEVEGKDYIALEALDGSEDVYLYGYKPTEDDFELLALDEPTFEKVAAEFESLQDEPL